MNVTFSPLPDFVFVDRLKELAAELSEEIKTQPYEMLDKIQQKLKVESAACADYVGPSYRRTEETLFSILCKWKQNNPTATIRQLAQHLFDLEFIKLAYKLNPTL